MGGSLRSVTEQVVSEWMQGLGVESWEAELSIATAEIRITTLDDPWGTDEHQPNVLFVNQSE